MGISLVKQQPAQDQTPGQVLVAFYRRVSTAEQELEGHSPEFQKTEMLEQAELGREKEKLVEQLRFYEDQFAQANRKIERVNDDFYEERINYGDRLWMFASCVRPTSVLRQRNCHAQRWRRG
jgi:hypothetical protein